jgi:uncharacterized oxidoreductase
MDVTGNTVLVTGGGTGIGLALAEAFAARGNQVIICGRRREKLEEAAARIPGLATRACDLSRPGERRRLAEWATARFPDLDVLVNNAGVQNAVDLLAGERDLPLAEEEVAVNLIAPLHLTALLVPHLAARPRAAVVNISSGLAFTPLAMAPVYCATKAAIHSLSLSLRHQLRDTPVRVFEAAPPIVETELGRAHRRGRRIEADMTPGEVAAGVLDAMERDTYEVALGAAAGLRQRREELFGAINR